jgi:hypothetical protein
MAMGVRKSDKEKKVILDKLIINNADKISEIIKRYNVPLVTASKNKISN